MEPRNPTVTNFVLLDGVRGLGALLLLICQSFRPPHRFTALFVLGRRISYAIYILHQLVREIIERVQWKSMIVSDLAPWSDIAVMALVVVVAIVAERYYDRPVRTAIVAWQRSREATRAALMSVTGRPSRRRLTTQRR